MQAKESQQLLEAERSQEEILPQKLWRMDLSTSGLQDSDTINF
jgi:hypothetical protein